LFITMAKEGSVISGMMDAFATSISIALQYGVPLPVLVNKFVHMRFEPSGFTNNEHIRVAKSIVDYIFRWLALKFLGVEDQRRVGVNLNVPENKMSVGTAPANSEELHTKLDEEIDKNQQSIFEKKKETKKNTDIGSAHIMTFDNSSDAPACDTCGSIMVRNASCYKCLNCGSTSGCS